MKLKAFVDWLLCREKLRARNDYLVNANRRLGLQILEFRKERGKPKGLAKNLMQQVESLKSKLPRRVQQLEEHVSGLKVKLYLRNIESQRQSLLVKAFKQHVDPSTFNALCRQFNSLTDEQIEAMK